MQPPTVTLIELSYRLLSKCFSQIYGKLINFSKNRKAQRVIKRKEIRDEERVKGEEVKKKCGEKEK